MWGAGERLVGELAPELVPMLASLEMPANFIGMTNTVLAEMARRGITRDKVGSPSAGCQAAAAGVKCPDIGCSASMLS